jgi:hypothetical protein
VAPVISLIGNDTILMEVYGNINDPGTTVSDNYYMGLKVITDSSLVNRNVIGIYKMLYTSTDSANNTGYATRWVIVGDSSRPVITLNGDDTVRVDVYNQYYEPGAKVTDNYCTSGLQWQVDMYPPTNNLATYTLTYTAVDCTGNLALPVKRVVQVIDRQKPVINLNGFEYVTLNRWETYTDEGVSIDDNIQKLLCSRC